SADCDEGFECKDNACPEIANYCSAKKPCPPGRVCRNNRCGPECDAANPCPAGQKCEAAKCVPDVGSSDTIPSKDPNMTCVNHQCVAKKKWPASCRTGKECKEGDDKCSDIDGWCDSDFASPCPAGKKCCPNKGEKCKSNKCEAPAAVSECNLTPILFDF